MKNKIITRSYQISDAQVLANIYYHTIHNINIRDYSIDQVNAWAPTSSLELDGWKKKWEKLSPIVALINDVVVGFTEFELTGYIDCFYVHHEYQGVSVGSALMAEIEINAKKHSIQRMYSEVSITARPFFEKKGFQVVEKQNVNIRGCQLTNFLMEKIRQDEF